MATKRTIELAFTKAYRKVWADAQAKVDKLVKKRDRELAALDKPDAKRKRQS